MGKGRDKPHRRARADEAQEIAVRLSAPAVMLTGKELAFVASVGRQVKRTGHISGKQLAWLRALQLKHWGVSELAQATEDA